MNKTEIAEFVKKSVSIINHLTEENEVLSEKSETWDKITNTDNLTEMSKVAKILNYKNLGRNKLFEFLRYKDILCRDNEPKQDYVNRGYFVLRPIPYDHNGEKKMSYKTYVTANGIDFIRRLIDADSTI